MKTLASAVKEQKRKSARKARAIKKQQVAAAKKVNEQQMEAAKRVSEIRTKSQERQERRKRQKEREETYWERNSWLAAMDIPDNLTKDLSISAFESSMKTINHSMCLCCRKVSININLDKKGVCANCVSFRDVDYYLKRNALPVWYDERGCVQYHVPQCLSSLSIAEKMLIQLASPFVPLKHIKHGTMGLTGHVCAFQQDIEGFVNTLPRCVTETTMVSLIKVVTNEFGSDEKREELFSVDRRKIGLALKWLKKYNIVYKDINIDMTRLDWMTGDVDTIQHVVIESQDVVNTEEEAALDICNDLGPCPTFTRQTIANGPNIKELGTIEEYGDAELSPDDAAIRKEVKDCIDDCDAKRDICLKFPRREVTPINEYGSSKLFPMVYPWLFPGGIGDIKDFPGNANKWGNFIHQYQDGRFGADPFFAFFASNYIVRSRNSSSSNWFVKNFNHNGPKTLEELKESIKTNNTKFINQLTYYSKSIKGSSPYWFHKKHELYSWVNYHVEAGHGPPSFFITLSCAEYQWPDMIRLVKQRMDMAGDDSSSCYVGSPKMSSILNKYAIVIQEVFQKRVETWLENVGKIVFGIKHHWTRYEFAPGRGQIHAHILAITSDTKIMELCHNDLKKENGKAIRDKRLATWAETRFGLCASVEPGFDERMQPSDTSPCTLRYHEVDDKENDIQDLLKTCQVHMCSGFCLRSKDKKSRRRCRAGAGFEENKGAADTPGFELRDHPEVVLENKTYRLQMPRNHRRVNQTSHDLLKSWRGNCDIQILVYKSHPTRVDAREISKVTDYVVAYNCKGNATMREEQEMNKQICLAMEETTGDDYDLKRVTKKIMNKTASRRLISKQEASVLLSDLPLTACSEMIENISISNWSRIKLDDGEQRQDARFITLYAKREKHYHGLSLRNYWHVHRTQIKKKTGCIPNFVGLSTTATYPVSESYAKHVLIVHKPWNGDYPCLKNWHKLFDQFIKSDECPVSARMEYDRVVQRHFDKTKFVEPVATKADHSANQISDEDQAILILGGMGANEIGDYESAVFDKIERGQDFKWDAPPKTRNLSESGMKYSPSEWLEKTVEDRRTREEEELFVPMKPGGRHYEIEDLYPEQQYVAYTVLSKIREFMVADDLANFKPLRCTLNGQAGTGKSVLINTVTSVLRRMFNYNNVVKVTAPTGVAAFNVGGETLHAFSCQKGKRSDGNTGSSSQSDKETMLRRYKHLLCLIIDERSMVSSALLGSTQQRVEQNIYQGLGLDRYSWGGLPVLILAGDDYQLPGIHQGAIESLFRSDGGKTTINGRESFKECSSCVFQLKTVRRIGDERQKDKDLLDRLRTGDAIQDEDVARLQRLHIENIEKVHGKEYAEGIRKQSVYLFWTNDKRIKHNIAMLSEMNTPDNPSALVKARSVGKNSAKAVAKHFKPGSPTSALFCTGAKVAMHSKNFFPSWGLHNGACGTVEEIVFDKDTSPNKGDLPKYVVVDFPLYCGPIWDTENRTHVPVPLVTHRCDSPERCCLRTFVPLDLAFARTIHKFQGLSAGPVDEGKIENIYKSIICDPDVKAAESRNTGLLYTAVSRATTLGDEDGRDSAIYFDGPNLTVERVKGVAKKTGSTEEYKNVKKRRMWVQHLQKNIVHPEVINDEQFAAFLRWTKSRYGYDDLYHRTNLYVGELGEPVSKKRKKYATSRKRR